MSFSSLVNLPPDVMVHILQYLTSEPVSICRLACTCHVFQDMLISSDNDYNYKKNKNKIWKALYDNRWKTESISNDSNDDDDDDWKDYLLSYRSRHLQDQQTANHLLDIVDYMVNTAESKGSRDYKCFFLEDWVEEDVYVPFKHPSWQRILSLLSFSAGPLEFLKQLTTTIKDTGTSDINTSTGCSNQNWFSNQVASKTTHFSLLQCIAAHLIEEIQHGQILQDWTTLITTTVDDDDEADFQLLQKGIILISKSLKNTDHSGDYTSSSSHNDDLEDVSKHATQRLDEIGKKLQNRMDQHQTDLNSLPDEQRVRKSVQLLNTLLVEELGFRGNVEDYYNVQNSCIASVIQYGKGIPLTLAILYKILLHRVNIVSHVIGLPGHVVLGLPTGTSNTMTTFVDVFSGGSFLTLEHCQMIAARYGFLIWHPALIRPLTARNILIRMLNNIMNCREKAVARSRSSRNIINLHRAQILLSISNTSQNPEQYSIHCEDLLSKWMERDPTLDPELFRKYGVIGLPNT